MPDAELGEIYTAPSGSSRILGKTDKVTNKENDMLEADAFWGEYRAIS